MKTLLTSSLSLVSSALLAASPLATQDWVRQFVGDSRSQASAASVQASASPSAVSATASGTATMDGERVTMSATISSPPSVSFEIVASDISSVPAGTRYAFNQSFGTFDNASVTGMPTVLFERIPVVTVSTNVMGSVTTVTNFHESYRSSVSGVPYRSTVHRGHRYLVGPLGMNGTKCRFCLQLRPSATASVARVTSPILAAYADGTYSQPQEGIWGSVEIGKITWEKNGFTYEFTGEYTGSFTLGAFDSLGKFVSATLDSFEAGDSQSIQSSAELLGTEVLDPRNWGLFKDGANKMTGTDGRSISYSAFRGSEFWSQLSNGVSGYLLEEYWRLVSAYFAEAAEHTCPYKQGPWTPADNCRCQFTYRDRSGQMSKCLMNNVSQHVWNRFRASGGSLVMTDGDGCSLCARCHQPNPEEGAIHQSVPDTDEFDWCGCYCKYYFTKKETDDGDHEEEEEEQEPEEPVDPPDDEDAVTTTEEIGTDTTYEETTVNGKTVYKPVNRVVATNEVALSERGWSHVRVRMRDPWGIPVHVIRSRATADAGDEDERHHCDPVTDPMQCTCKCGLHHTFKPSPCRRICRGCGSHQNDYNNWLSTNSVSASWHSAFPDGRWDPETYVDEDGDEQIWDPRTDGPYASWYAGATNGTAGCGCACGKRRTSPLGTPGEWGDHASFHCYASKPTSLITDAFTKWFVETKLGLARVEYCSCNNYDWEVENRATLSSGQVGSAGRPGCNLPTCRNVCMFHGISHRTGGKNFKDHTGIMSAESATSWDWPLGSSTVPANDVESAFNEYSEQQGRQLLQECGCICGAVTEETCGEYGIDAWPGETGEMWHAIDVFGTNCICYCGHNHICVDDGYLETVDPNGILPFHNRTACPGVCAFCGYYSESGPTNSIRRAPASSHVPASATCSCKCHAETSFRKRFKNSRGILVRGYDADSDGFDYPNNTMPGSKGYTDDYDEAKAWHHMMDGRNHLCTCNGQAYRLLHNHVPGSACKDSCKTSTGVLPTDICNHAAAYYKGDPSAPGENIPKHVHTDGGEYCGCDCGWDLMLGGSGYAHFAQTNECYCFHSLASARYHDNASMHPPSESNPTGRVFLGHKGPIENVSKSDDISATCDNCHQEYTYVIASNRCNTCNEIIADKFPVHECENLVRCCTCNPRCDVCTCSYCLYRIGEKCTCCGNASSGSKRKKYEDGVVSAGQYAESSANDPDVEIVDGSDPVLVVRERGFMGAWSNCVNLVLADFSKTETADSQAFSYAFAGCTNLKRVAFGSLDVVGHRAFWGAFKGCSSLEHIDFSGIDAISDCMLEDNYGCTSTNLVITFGTTNPVQIYETPLHEMFTAIREIRFLASPTAYPAYPVSYYVKPGSSTIIRIPAANIPAWTADPDWAPYAGNIRSLESLSGN